MRGKHAIGKTVSVNTRITPADAGKTCNFALRILDRQDHPRGCGENHYQTCAICGQQGSPPRMRGKQLNLVKAARWNGITPADAGKLANPSRPTVFTGITPADAGKTIEYDNRYGKKWDHPRGCGENPVLHDFRAVGTGSPPRMRGKLSPSPYTAAVSRITPADAGKTLDLLQCSGQRQDHPRGCGENDCRRSEGGGFVGSPPRMRGKPDTTVPEYNPVGITPADAGKTTCNHQPDAESRDHPRGCGEN